MGERVEVADVDVYPVAWLDVGDLLLEDVRAMLGQETGLVALG